MIIDKLLEFSVDQPVTSTQASTNTVDFRQKNPNLGLGRHPVYVVVNITEDVKGATGITFSLQDSDSETTGFSDIAVSGKIPVSELKAGAQFAMQMPIKNRRYVRMNYTVDGSGTGGKVCASIVEGLQMWTPFSDSPKVWSRIK